MKITKSEADMILAFRAAQDAKWKDIQGEVDEIAAKVKDISRYLCPGCIQVLGKVVAFREAMAGPQ